MIVIDHFNPAEVLDYGVLEIPKDGKRRPVTTLTVRDSSGGSEVMFGVGLDWLDDRWTLEVDHELVPSYVRQSLDASNPIGDTTGQTK